MDTERYMAVISSITVFKLKITTLKILGNYKRLRESIKC